MKTKILSLAFLGILVFSCSPKVVPPPPPQPPPLLVEENEKKFDSAAEEGKLLFENNCAKCHDLYAPKSYTAEEWKPILISMQKKAKISDVERELIYSYVTKN